jgi:CDP-paratose 2-epimerase
MGGGPDNAVSLLDVVEMIGQLSGDRPRLRWDDWRVADQRYYVSDTSAFSEVTGWRPRTGVQSGIASLYEWLGDAAGPRRAALAAAAATS